MRSLVVTRLALPFLLSCSLLMPFAGCRSPLSSTVGTTQGSLLGLGDLPQPPPLRGIVLHHSQSPGIWRGVKIDAERLNDIHRETHPDWLLEWEGKKYYIGYHYVILPDGTIEKGRPESAPGAHARTYNGWFGICLIGSFDSHYRQFNPSYPTVAQQTSLIELCKDLMLRYHIPWELVKRHGDVNDTDCPGNRFPYEAIVDELRTFALLHREEIPPPPDDFRIVKPPPLHNHRSEH